MDLKLTTVFVQANTYWENTYCVLEKKEGDIKALLASSIYLTSNFAFSCELYLKGVIGYLGGDTSHKLFKSYGHDLQKLFYHLPVEVQSLIIDEYKEVVEVKNKRFFNKKIDFNLALENSKKSFEECRYFFEKVGHHEPTSINFYFLCELALAIHFYVLNNTDFDLDKTKSQLFQK